MLPYVFNGIPKDLYALFNTTFYQKNGIHHLLLGATHTYSESHFESLISFLSHNLTIDIIC